jgi:hypothetical protein
VSGEIDFDGQACVCIHGRAFHRKGKIEGEKREGVYEAGGRRLCADLSMPLAARFSLLVEAKSKKIRRESKQ